eukprot:2183-Eustigmatos_ZCMA.PRE.1
MGHVHDICGAEARKAMYWIRKHTNDVVTLLKVLYRLCCASKFVLRAGRDDARRLFVSYLAR